MQTLITIAFFCLKTQDGVKQYSLVDFEIKDWVITKKILFGKLTIEILILKINVNLRFQYISI